MLPCPTHFAKTLISRKILVTVDDWKCRASRRFSVVSDIRPRNLCKICSWILFILRAGAASCFLYRSVLCRGTWIIVDCTDLCSARACLCGCFSWSLSRHSVQWCGLESDWFSFKFTHDVFPDLLHCWRFWKFAQVCWRFDIMSHEHLELELEPCAICTRQACRRKEIIPCCTVSTHQEHSGQKRKPKGWEPWNWENLKRRPNYCKAKWSTT